MTSRPSQLLRAQIRPEFGSSEKSQKGDGRIFGQNMPCGRNHGNCVVGSNLGEAIPDLQRHCGDVACLHPGVCGARPAVQRRCPHGAQQHAHHAGVGPGALSARRCTAWVNPSPRCWPLTGEGGGQEDGRAVPEANAVRTIPQDPGAYSLVPGACSPGI